LAFFNTDANKNSISVAKFGIKWANWGPEQNYNLLQTDGFTTVSALFTEVATNGTRRQEG